MTRLLRNVRLPVIPGRSLDGQPLEASRLVVGGASLAELVHVGRWAKLMEGSFREAPLILFLEGTAEQVRAAYSRSRWPSIALPENVEEWRELLGGATVFAAYGNEVLAVGPVTDAAWEEFEAFAPATG